MENPVGEVLQLISKRRLKKPDFQFRKKQGQWECTCVIRIDSKTIEESSIAQTKKEAKAQSSRQIIPVLKQYLENASWRINVKNPDLKALGS